MRTRPGVVFTSLATLSAVASLVVAGCDSSPFRNVAPLSRSDMELSKEIMPDDGGTPGADPAEGTTLGGPLARLDAADLERFHVGQEEFEEEETPEEGLGPVFNERACATCHDAPVGGTTGRAETRFGKFDNGRFDHLADKGGSLLQDQAIGKVRKNGESFTFVPEEVPRRANVTASRITTPLFGLGLVDAIPDAALLDLARSQARNTPSTKGTPNMVTDVASGATRVGRFGWKSQIATLRTFSADAYLNEMGITSPTFPIENAPQGNTRALRFNPFPELNDDGEGVENFLNFMTLLGPPPRGRRSDASDAGARTFREAGCANCHTPTHTTGPSPVPALSRKSFQPFSDFLVHDMGSLGDGVTQGQATGRMMRTAPLWGLSSRPVFLHDGRARTPEAAILAHSGQGAAARQRFQRLSSRERFNLLQFLRTL